MKVDIVKLKRKCVPFVSLFVAALLLTNASCKQTSDTGSNGKASTDNSSATTDGTSATPPFQTKEPERYQATWVTTGSDGPASASSQGLSMLTGKQMAVARDGANRRMETEMLPGVKIIYLQTTKGRFALLPAKKLYAEITLDKGNNPVNSTGGMPSDFSPEKMMSGAPAGAKYEKLGTEEVGGRMTTKYRSIVSGDGPTAGTQMIVWADESLGMPIKIEMTSKEGARFSVEMRDIKLEVDPTVFELPRDYQKVEHADLFSSALPSVKDLLGTGNENKGPKKR